MSDRGSRLDGMWLDGMPQGASALSSWDIGK